MNIKQIHIEKSRTIEVDGMMGRDKFRKITIGMVADIEKEDTPHEAYEDLSNKVNEAINYEIKALNSKTRKMDNKSGEGIKQQLLG